MSYNCQIICDSISETGKRLTTFEITFPRIVLAEFNTHRMFSRNSASSRAIPIRKMLDKVLIDPFIPDRFPVSGKGMQPGDYFEPETNGYRDARSVWLDARLYAIKQVEKLQDVGVRKQIANRLLEPWLWHTVIVTATEWANFFKLRCHPDAQEQIKIIADVMYQAYHWNFDCYSNKVGTTKFEYDNSHIGTISSIQELKAGEWHCPYVSSKDDEALEHLIDFDLPDDPNPDYWKTEFKKRISVARCARISYLTHDGQRDVQKPRPRFLMMNLCSLLEVKKKRNQME